MPDRDARLEATISAGSQLVRDGQPLRITVELDRELAESLAAGDHAPADRPGAGGVRRDPAGHSQPHAPASSGATDLRVKNLELLLNVELPATIRFGQKQMRLQEILQLSAGAVIDWIGRCRSRWSCWWMAASLPGERPSSWKATTACASPNWPAPVPGWRRLPRSGPDEAIVMAVLDRRSEPLFCPPAPGPIVVNAVPCSACGGAIKASPPKACGCPARNVAAGRCWLPRGAAWLPGAAGPAANRMPLGLLLVSQGRLREEQVRAALERQRQSGEGRIGAWLQRLRERSVRTS